MHLAPEGTATVGPVKLEVARGLATVVAGEGAEGAALSLTVGEATLRVPVLPVQLDVDTAQPHVLHAEKPGFAPYHQPLVFEDGQAEKTFSVTLAPLPGAEATVKKRAKGRRRRPSGRRGQARAARER